MDQGLVIELDGGQHFEEDVLAYDRARTLYLRRGGISVIRFTNDQVLRERERS